MQEATQQFEVPVFNLAGEKVDTFMVDATAFGAEVNAPLLKQAIVTYHANRRQGTVQTKSRGMVDGSTRKLFRQKGTGNARRGPRRTNVLKGGGMAFAKAPRDYRKRMPRKMRRRALDSAILAKILGEDLMVLEGLSIDAPKTATMADVLKNLSINRSCLLAIAQRDHNVYLSSRNIPDLTVRVSAELNAFDVATRRKMIVTREAMQALVDHQTSNGASTGEVESEAVTETEAAQ